MDFGTGKFLWAGGRFSKLPNYILVIGVPSCTKYMWIKSQMTNDLLWPYNDLPVSLKVRNIVCHFAESPCQWRPVACPCPSPWQPMTGPTCVDHSPSQQWPAVSCLTETWCSCEEHPVSLVCSPWGHSSCEQSQQNPWRLGWCFQFAPGQTS